MTLHGKKITLQITFFRRENIDNR